MAPHLRIDMAIMGATRNCIWRGGEPGKPGRVGQVARPENQRDRFDRFDGGEKIWNIAG